MAWAGDQGAAFEDAIRVLTYAGVFVLVVLVARSGDAGTWLRGLAIGTTAIVAIAVIARLEPSLFGHPERELAAQVPADADRLSWPIGYWNGLAAVVAIAVGLLAWLGAEATTRAARCCAVALLPLAVLGLYATTSRGGMIATAVALLVLVVCGPRRLRLALSCAVGLLVGGALVLVASGRDELFDLPGTEAAATQGDQVLIMLAVAVAAAAALRFWLDPWLERLEAPRIGRRAWQAAAVGAAIAAIAALAFADPVERFEEFKRPPTATDTAGEGGVLARGGSSGRWQFWSAAFDAFESEPIRGIGAGGYPAWWNQHGSLAADTRNAHSLAMDTLAELGLLGVTAAVAFFGVVAVTGVRRVRAAGPTGRSGRGPAGAALAVFATALVGVAGDWTWELSAVLIPGIVAAGLLTGPATLATDPQVVPIRGEVRSRRRFAAGVAVLVFAWVAICASGLLVASRYGLDASEDALAEGDLTRAAEQANNAIDLEPWAADPRRGLAEALLAAGDLPGAERAIDEAIDRADQDPELWLVAAQIQLAGGDRAAAAADVEEAKQLAPRAPELQPSVDELLAQIQ